MTVSRPQAGMQRLWHFIAGLPDGLASQLSDSHDDQHVIDALVGWLPRPESWYAVIAVLNTFFWNNRSDLVRRFFRDYSQSRRVEDEAPGTAFTLLRLSEMSGSEQFVTSRTLSSLERLFDAFDDPPHRGVLERLRFGIDLRQRGRTLALVSLGQDCLPWDLPNHWHVRRELDMFVLEGPFDLAAHGSSALAESLRDDFTSYSDASKYSIVSTETGTRMAVHMPTQSAFNHHVSDYWYSDHNQAFFASQAIRVETLRESFADPSLMYLYHSRTVRTAAEARMLFGDITSCETPGALLKDRLMLILNTDPSLEPVRERLGDRCIFVVMPRPGSDYTWYEVSDFSSDRGMRFERQIVDLLLETRETGLR